MNVNDILDMIGETEDKYIRDAHESKSSRRGRQLINIAIGAAACVVLVPMLLMGGFTLFFGGFGAASEAPSAGMPVNTESGSFADEAYTEFMAYQGPVLPLTTLENSEGIETARRLDISFAPLSDENRHSPAVALTDSYVLKNTSTEDISLTAVYPYVASYYESAEESLVPELLIDGAIRSITEGELVYGPYSGSFVPVYGAEDDPEMASANLSGPSSFYDYVNLLSDDSYMAASFDDPPMPGTPVIVYRLSDYEFTSDTRATNPTLNFSFEMDSEKTRVFTWNFNGGSNNVEEGKYERHSGGIELRPYAAPENQYPGDALLIVVGEDIENRSVQGYRNGGCKDGEELADLGCIVKRYESTLEEVLLELLSAEMPDDAEALYPIVLRELYLHGPIGSEPVTRYSDGMLDSFVYDVKVQNRIAYLSFAVTVPAESEVSVELRSIKRASYNHYGSSEATELYGFEFATRLGSSLAFTEQRASLSDYENIEIASSNFGFDLESGETETLLDPNTECYWLNIREKRVEE